MKYAIVESGGKQYKAVEGETIEVDRLPLSSGDELDLVNVLLVVDGENVTVGTPTVNGMQVGATVLGHVSGPKITVFKYSPKKRIRVKGGHRQQYTRLMVDSIGDVEAPKAKKAEKKADKPKSRKEAKPKKPAEKKPAEPKKPAAAKKTAEAKKPVEKKKAPKQSTPKKPSATKSTKTTKTKKD